MIALDLFCGLGGWSDGLKLEGFNVLGIEIEPKIARLYDHDCIIADCSNLPLRSVKWDLIVGSPPCRDFSAMIHLGYKWWKRKPDPEGEGMRLINSFINTIKEFKPKYWLMENVPDSVKYIEKEHGIKPRTITRLGKYMRRVFYGNYPAFLIFRDFNKKVLTRTGRRKKKYGTQDLINSKWERAKIPLPISRELGRVLRFSLKK